MPGLRDIPGNHQLTAYFPGHATAGSTKEAGLGRAPFRCQVVSAIFIAAAAINGAATNYFTLNVRNRTTAGVGTVIPAALAFSNGTNAVAQAPTSLTLSSTAADLIIAEGDVLTVEKAVSGTGLACPDGLVIVTVKAY